MHFLVDTGADISVLPKDKNQHTPMQFQLYAANNTPNKTWTSHHNARPRLTTTVYLEVRFSGCSTTNNRCRFAASLWLISGPTQEEDNRRKDQLILHRKAHRHHNLWYDNTEV